MKLAVLLGELFLVLIGVGLVGYLIDMGMKAVHKPHRDDLSDMYEDASDIAFKKQEVSEKVAQKEEKITEIKDKLNT